MPVFYFIGGNMELAFYKNVIFWGYVSSIAIGLFLVLLIMNVVYHYFQERSERKRMPLAGLKPELKFKAMSVKKGDK